ncbi:hypothetical protein ACQ4PT_011262 [Festuca glaucescens]
MGRGNQHKVFVSMGGRYNETSDYGGYAVEGCNTYVVPVMGANGEANSRDYERLISDGFLLTWGSPPLAQTGSTGFSTSAELYILSFS